MNLPSRKSPPGEGGLNRNNSCSHRIHAGDPLQVLLGRLDRVRQYGKGWRAECPVGHKSHGTLSIAQDTDGRLLVHCFAGCDTCDLLAMVGLSLADLFPDRGRDLSPAGRQQRRQFAQQANWAAALGVLAFEATVIEIAAADLVRGNALDPANHDRLRLAVRRVHDAREVLR